MSLLEDHRLNDVCFDTYLKAAKHRKIRERLADVYAATTDGGITHIQYRSGDDNLIDMYTVYDVYEVLEDFNNFGLGFVAGDVLVIYRLGDEDNHALAAICIFGKYDRKKRMPSKGIGSIVVGHGVVCEILKHCFLIDSGY